MSDPIRACFLNSALFFKYASRSGNGATATGVCEKYSGVFDTGTEAPCVAATCAFKSCCNDWIPVITVERDSATLLEAAVGGSEDESSILEGSEGCPGIDV